MTKIIKEKVIYVLGMMNDITNSLKPEAYAKHLGELRSNSIGQQLWCLGGARESYGNAIESDGSFSWDCSFDYNKAHTKTEIDEYLNKTNAT